MTVLQRLHHLARNGSRRRSRAVEVKSLTTTRHGTPGSRAVRRLFAFAANGTLLETSQVRNEDRQAPRTVSSSLLYTFGQFQKKSSSARGGWQWTFSRGGALRVFNFPGGTLICEFAIS